MRWYDEQVVPRLVERTCRVAELEPLRAEVCADLSGRVLELGFGSGLNVLHYPPAVEEVAAVEPSDLAWRLAQRRVTSSSVPVRRSGPDGQQLSEPAASYDAVLVTFALCTIPDLSAAVHEARRVLRPGGVVHFLEHGLSPDARITRWQRRLEPVQRATAGGCHLTRRPDEALTRAGFELADLRTEYLPGPAPSRPWCYTYRGRAIAPR